MATETKNPTLKDRIRRDEIRATVTDLGEHIDGEGWRHRQWRITLSSRHWPGRFTTSTFRTGIGWERKPNAADLLECLLSDAAGVKNAEGFDDWCREYGYDLDSRKAEQTFIACITQTEQLENWLGARLNAYLWHTERL